MSSYSIKIKHLTEARRLIDVQIADLQRRPEADQSGLANLSTQRTKLQDELTRVRALEEEEEEQND